MRSSCSIRRNANDNSESRLASIEDLLVPVPGCEMTVDCSFKLDELVVELFRTNVSRHCSLRCMDAYLIVLAEVGVRLSECTRSTRPFSQL